VGAETAASVIFAKQIKQADDPKKMEMERIKEFQEKYENAYEGAKRGYIDDVIMPRDTRKYINRSLDLLEGKEEVRPYRKYSNINL